MSKAAEKWDAFIDIQRKSGQTIKQYIALYEKICKEYTDNIGTLSEMAKALHLLRTAKLTETQYELILAMNQVLSSLSSTSQRDNAKPRSSMTKRRNTTGFSRIWVSWKDNWIWQDNNKRTYLLMKSGIFSKMR